MAALNLTAARLREVLKYDPLTGDFTQLHTTGYRGCHKAGITAGGLDKSTGYMKIRVDQSQYFAHRLAWLYMTGAWPTDQVDHRDGQRCNNAFKNLRLANNAQNRQNLRAARVDSKSGVLGVSWNVRDKRWIAHLYLAGRCVHHSSHRTIEGAESAYLAAKRLWHPFAQPLMGTEEVELKRPAV